MTAQGILDECNWINRRLSAISKSAVGLGDSLVTQELRKRYAELEAMKPDEPEVPRASVPSPKPTFISKQVANGK